MSVSVASVRLTTAFKVRRLVRPGRHPFEPIRVTDGFRFLGLGKGPSA